MKPHPVPSSRVELMEHLRGCRSCRQAWLADDPSRIYTLLGDSEVEEELLQRVTTGVMAGIDRDGRTGRRKWSKAASLWAAAVLLAALLTPLVLDRTGEPGPVVAERQEQGRVRAGVEVVSTPGSPRVVDLTVGETQVVMIFDERLEL